MLVKIVNESNHTQIKGELTLESVPLLKSQQIKEILTDTSVTVDLSLLTKVDTAGLAWLFLLLEKAQKNNCILTFQNASNDLLKLAKLSGVEQFLPHKSL